jgi:hypothetical protein
MLGNMKMKLMKKNLILLIVIFALMSCEKENEPVIPVNSIAEDLKYVINAEGVEALQTCCDACTSCYQSIGWGTDYSFPGDNFVRIREDYYNLNLLIRYKIETITYGQDSEKRMILVFP